MTPRLPLLAILLSVAGLIPFIGCGLLALGQDRAGPQTMLWALMAYGAVILSFLGGIHWGFAIHPMVPAPAPRLQQRQLVLGVVPALVAWVAMFAVVGVAPWLGLCLLIAGFIGVAVVEQRSSQGGILPSGYMVMRWALTVVVVAMLVTVLTLRVLGQRVLM